MVAGVVVYLASVLAMGAGIAVERNVVVPAKQEADVAAVVARDKPDFDKGVRRIYACTAEQQAEMSRAINVAASGVYIQCEATSATEPVTDSQKAAYTNQVGAILAPR